MTELEGASYIDDHSNVFVELPKESLEEIIRKKIKACFDAVQLKHFDNLHSMVVLPADKAIVQYVLERTGGNQVHAAGILGINRNTLRKKMKLYGLMEVHG